MRKRIKLGSALLIGAALLAACVGARDSAPTPRPTWTPIVATSTPQPVEPGIEDKVGEDPTATSTPTSLPPATPTARPGLEATDPTMVNLGAGKPTLLEFFAFW